VASRRLIFVNRVYWPDEAATAQLLTDLTQGLAARGHDVHVVASGRGSREHRGVTIHHTGGGGSPVGLVGRALAYARFLFRARGIVRRLAGPGDVVVLKTDPPLLAAALTAPVRARGAAVVQWIQDIYPEIVPQHAGGWVAPLLGPLRARRDRAWCASTVCVVVGADMAATVAARGVPPERIRHIPNWAPRELQAAAAPDRIAARRADWDVTGKFVVAYSGNLGRVHEFDTLLDAAERLKAKRGIVFLFVGGGPRITEVRRRVADRRLGNVRFVRSVPREELPAALAAADVHAVTLRPGFEGLVNPSKVAGILAAGRPALFVGPPDCALARQIRERGAGLAFAPGEGEAMAAAVAALRAEPERLAAMGAAARAVYEADFQFERQLAAWEALLPSPGGNGVAEPSSPG
jgi:glycosyltransferase involved in cell wall biosynthesis